jgi:HSP20 family protein
MTGLKEKTTNGNVKAEPTKSAAGTMTPGEMTAYEPTALFQRFADDFERIANDFGLGLGRFAYGPSPGLFRRGRELLSKGIEGISPAIPWAPRIDVCQKGGVYTVSAELPGMEPKEIKVDIADGVVTIHGERTRASEKTEGGYTHSERVYGVFCREVAIPEGAEIDKAAVTYDKGVLTITVPVPEVPGTKARRLEVKGA